MEILAAELGFFDTSELIALINNPPQVLKRGRPETGIAEWLLRYGFWIGHSE